VHESAASCRVLLLGLDGVTWTLLRPWVEAGHLPHLERMMTSGAWGSLASTLAPQTPPAWTSMVTGVHPGKHGVFSFIRRKPGTYEKELTTSRHRQREALWDFAGREGKRSIIFDVPLTFPPDSIHGIMISGMGTPGWTADFVWPKELKETIIREFGQYEFDIYFDGDIGRFVEEASQVTEHRLASARHLLRRYPWDFFMTVLTTPDRLQHVVWKCVDERHPDFDPREAEKHRPGILRFYQVIDRAIGEFQTLVGEDTVFVLASDHGFGPVHTLVALSRWLRVEGLMALGSQQLAYASPEEITADAVRGGGEIGLEKGREILLRLSVRKPDDYAGFVLTIPGLRRSSNYEVRAVVVDATPGAALELNDLGRPGGHIFGGGPLSGPQEVSAIFQPQGDPVQIMVAMTSYGGNPTGHILVKSVIVTELEDWTRTTAYILDVGDAAESRRIRINLCGREPHGIVEPGAAYERVRETIMAKLRAMRDADGRPLFAGVWRDEEAFPGPCREDDADVLVTFQEGVAGTKTTGRADMAGPISFRSREGFSGRHEGSGVLVVKGPPISSGARVNAQIVDVCPTVLHLMGVPVPNDLDGRVLTEICTPAYQAKHPVRLTVPTARAALSPSREEAYTAAERQQVEDRLKRLGYID